MVKAAKTLLNVNVVQCASHQYDGEKADLCVLSSVIEHLHNPVGVLTSIRENILTPRGRIIVSAPNILSTQVVADENCLSLFNHIHVWYFSEKTLDMVLQKSGFKLIENYKPTFNLTGIHQKLKRYIEKLIDIEINCYGGVAGIWESEL